MTGQMPIRVFCGLGSNVGNRLDYLKRAVDALFRLEWCRLVRSSSVYETGPVGYENQDDFLNTVIEFEWSATARKLLDETRRIESACGRQRSVKWGPRTLDIDILIFGGYVINLPGLIVPHPEIRNRKFVLVPLSELNYELSLPGTGETIGKLLRACPDNQPIHKIASEKTLCPNEE